MLNIFTQKKSKKDEQLPFMYFYDIQNKKPDEFIIKTSSPSPSPSPIVPTAPPLLTDKPSSYVSPSDSSPYNPSYIPPTDETISEPSSSPTNETNTTLSVPFSSI